MISQLIYTIAMKYLFFVYCPDDKKVIDDIILAASNLGAGVYGNYSQCAFITHGEGTWKSEYGAHPVEGKVGEVTRTSVAKIAMSCDRYKAKEIEQAIQKIHPWEQVDIEFIEIKSLPTQARK